MAAGQLDEPEQPLPFAQRRPAAPPAEHDQHRHAEIEQSRRVNGKPVREAMEPAGARRGNAE